MLVYKEFTWILEKHFSKPALFVLCRTKRKRMLWTPHWLHPCNLFAPEKLCREVKSIKNKYVVFCLSLLFFFFATPKSLEDCRDFLTDGVLFYISAFWEELVSLLDIPIKIASRSCAQRIHDRMIYRGHWQPMNCIFMEDNKKISVRSQSIVRNTRKYLKANNVFKSNQISTGDSWNFGWKSKVVSIMHTVALWWAYITWGKKKKERIISSKASWSRKVFFCLGFRPEYFL